MRTIYEAKSFVKSALGKDVVVKVLGIRNKNEIIKGTIIECYPNIFVIESNNMKKSYTYADVLIGNVVIRLK